jgi:hypothetical protein
VQVPASAKLALQWSSKNASTVDIDGLGTGLTASGKQEIPTRDAVYLLVAVAPDATKSSPVRLEVHTHADDAAVSAHAMIAQAPPPEPADQAHFEKLPEGHQKAFLDFDSAIVNDGTKRRYATLGFFDKNKKRRIVRAVKLKAGTRIYKLTGGLEKIEPRGKPYTAADLADKMRDLVLLEPVKRTPAALYPFVSPWWVPVRNFEEATETDSDGSITQAFKDMVFNRASFSGEKVDGKNVGLSLREFGRFMSAVVLEWNKLNYYVEITLAKDVYSYWGQFEPQAGTELTANQARAAWGWTKDESDEPVRKKVNGNEYIQYPNEDELFYLPTHLGGMGAWQLYIPKFEQDDIDFGKMKVIPSTDDAALAKHFKCEGVFDAAKQQAAANMASAKPAPQAAPAAAPQAAPAAAAS